MTAPHRSQLAIVAIALTVGLAGATPAFAFNLGGSPDPEPPPTDTGGFGIEELLTGLESPWGMAFLPDGRLLVTEKPGRLNLVDVSTGTRTVIPGTPEVASVGQGGLLDIALHPDFASNRWVYLTYADGDAARGYATHVGRGRLDLASMRITDFTELHVATPFVSTDRHFGSRIAFDGEWNLYMTVGDRGTRNNGQDTSTHHGKVLRLTAAGGIPADNPFAARPEDGLPAIFSWGHRNPQSMAVDPETTRIWVAEHGERAGDEVNILRNGGNFGWPVATYAREYTTGAPVGVLPSERPDLVPPVHYWDDSSFAPSGMTFYRGEAFPEWQNSLFLGSLARQYLARLEIQGDQVLEEDRLLEDKGWRIRDVESGPEGYLYVLVDADSAALIRLIPATDD